ncbi:hypothetical protein J6590_057071 [Homalodisca vitripennis]|nr:hypothetical protein J6590_057071 [Homalodisca vitripennis]
MIISIGPLHLTCSKRPVPPYAARVDLLRYLPVDGDTKSSLTYFPRENNDALTFWGF